MMVEAFSASIASHAVIAHVENIATADQTSFQFLLFLSALVDLF